MTCTRGDLRSNSAASGPACVTRLEWTLAASALIVGLFSYATTRHEEIVSLVLILTGGSIILTALALMQALNGRLIGKFLLMASMLWMFWLQAASSALAEIPFRVADDVPLATPQFGLALIQKALVYMALFQISL